MKSIYTLRGMVFALLLFGLSQTGFSQYDKYLEKAAEAQEKGDYAGARKMMTKMKKKVTKKLGTKNPYLAIVLVREGEINWALGMYNQVEPLINQGVAMSNEITDSLSTEHGFLLKEAAEALIKNGSILLAEKYLNSAERAFKASNSLIEDVEAELEVGRAKILFEKGFYNQAIELIDSRMSYFEQRATNKQGKKAQVERRLEDLAELKILKGQALASMGDLDEADKILELQNMAWLKDKLGKTHVLFGYNTYVLAEAHKKTVVASKAVEWYEDAWNNARRKYEQQHWMVLKMEQELLVALFRNGNKGKFANLESTHKKTIKEFGKKSYHNIARDVIDIKYRILANDFRGLEDDINKILANEAVPRLHKVRVDILRLAQTVAVLSKNTANVENYGNEILAIQEQLIGKDAPEYHLDRLRQANYYIDYTDKLDEASITYLNSWYNVVEPEIHIKHEDYLKNVNHLAKFYEETDNYKLASELLEDALRASQTKFDNKDPEYALELEKIANLQMKIGQYENAEENLTKCLEILDDTDYEELADSYRVGALLTQAKLFAIKGEYDEADDNLFASEKLQRKSAVTLETAGLDHADDKASLYINVGQYGNAQKLLDESVNDKENRFGKDSRQLIQPLTLLAKLYLVKGEYQKAEDNTRRALDISRKLFGDESTKIVPAKLMLADIYITIGDYDKAMQQLQGSIEIQQSRFGPEHVDVGKSVSQLALVKFYKGEPLEETLPVFEQAEKIIGKKLGSENPTYAEILKNMAIANISAGKYEIARSYLEVADRIWQSKIGRRNNINSASVAMLYGDINYRQREYARAEDFYREALKKYGKTFSEKHPEYVKIQSKLSKTYYMQDDWSKSQDLMEQVLVNYSSFIEDYFPALSEREKAKFWNTIKGNYEFYNTLIIKKARSPKYVSQIFNNALLTKGLLLSTSIKIRQRIMGSNDQELIGMYGDWVNKKELLTVALAMSPEQLAQNEIDPAQLQDDVEVLEKEMSLRSELFKRKAEQKVVTWENVRDALNENEVAIEMVRFRLFDHEFSEDSIMYAMLYIEGGKRERPQMILLENGKDMETKFLQNYRNSIKFRLPDAYSYDVFWKPIIEKIGTLSTVYISPDGAYNQINLEAIPTPDGRYVLDNSNIIIVNNTKDLYLDQLYKRTESPKSNKMASMFGNPTFYVSTEAGQPVAESGLSSRDVSVITDLPGTKVELDEVGELLDRKGLEVDKYMEKDADEATIKTIDNPRIFHVATHGFFKDQESGKKLDELNAASAYDNPLLKTGLLLTGAGDILNETKYNYNVDNGILTAYEALNLNLDETDLVVLSACETALGKVEAGEGVYGLQRAFLVAGARTIVMSLFKVSDEATQKLMVLFYRKWLETGKKRESFIEAKKEIRNEYQDPIYWGPFIMVGLE